MDARRTSEIESEALRVLRDTGQSHLPVDVIAVAHALGIPVYDARFAEPQISGAIQKSADGGRIWVNQFESAVRQRFTVAHELGHWVLHMVPGDAWSEPQNLVDVELVEWRRDVVWSGSDKEREANRFAAALLMPWPLVDALRLSHPKWSVAALADACEVSVSAMRIRLEEMEHRTWASLP